jgi:Mg-chelatase subunit ChlD
MHEINGLDLAFVVDTTGSMGTFIQAAQRQMIALMEKMATAADVRLRVGLVEYRDHPPQDQMLYCVHAFTDDLGLAQKTINGLRAMGGGDGPEAVLDGLGAACRELGWRPHARRIAVLVGDAPPHGVGSPGDGFAKGCPCGQTVASVTALAEAQRVLVYALGLTSCVEESFGRLARWTGGEYFPAARADAALERLQEILRAEFGHLDFDARALAAWQADPDLTSEELASWLESTPGAVSAAWTRLASRRLLAAREVAPLVIQED